MYSAQKRNSDKTTKRDWFIKNNLLSYMQCYYVLLCHRGSFWIFMFETNVKHHF